MEKSTTNPIVKFSCVGHQYPDKTKIEVCGMQFEVNEGDRIAIVGPNGCGKTTLLKHMLGLLAPVKGEISVFGVNPADDYDKIREKIGVVMQDVEEQLLGPTVYDDIAFSPRNYGWNEKRIAEEVKKIMADLGIRHLSNKLVHYLSGGEKRKVALAGALVLRPKLLILDEPFENLDYKSSHDFVDYLNEYNRKKKTTLIYSVHDMHLLPKISGHIYFMLPGGKIGDYGKTNEILKSVDLAKYNLEIPHI